MKKRVSTLSKSDLKYLVKTFRIPLDLHPRLPDSTFTMDRLPSDTIGIYSEFLRSFGVRIPFLTFLLFVLKYFNARLLRSRSYNGSFLSLQDHNRKIESRSAIPEHLTWRYSHSCVFDDLPTDGYDRNDVERLHVHLICLREMREEVFVRSGLSFVWSNKECDLVFRRNDDNSEMSIYGFMTLLSWGDAKIVEEPHRLSEPLLERPSQPSKKMRLKKRASKAVTSAPELGQAEGLNEGDITDFYAELEDSMERDEGTSIKVASVPTPRLAHASTSGRSLALGGSSVGGFVRKFGVEAMRRQMDPLDALARSALSRDAEYDWIPKDDFGITTRGEEIELTLFHIASGPYQMSYLNEGVSSPLYTKEEWDGPHAPKRGLSLCFHWSCRIVLMSLVLRWFLMTRYTDLVASKVRLQDKFDRKKGDVKLLRSEVTSLDNKLENVQRDYDALGHENRKLCSQIDVAYEEVKKLQSQLADARVASVGLTKELVQTDEELSKQALTVRDLQNELALEKSRSHGYKNAVDKLSMEVTQFISFGVEGLIRRLLSSDEFNAALAHVASLGINYGVERGLRMGRTDADFEVAAQKVSNFHIGVEADFNKAPVAFPTTSFPFLGKVDAAAGGMTALVPYARLNGVSPLLALGVVLWAHNTFGSSSTHAHPSWSLVRSCTPDMSRSLISRCWHPDAYLDRNLCIRAVALILVASLIIALTSVVSTDRSLRSSVSTPFVSPSHCTAASLLKASAFLFSSLDRSGDTLTKGENPEEQGMTETQASADLKAETDI
nr:hypothetical protein [Tanacetum cinerariifolium]